MIKAQFGYYEKGNYVIRETITSGNLNREEFAESIRRRHVELIQSRGPSLSPVLVFFSADSREEYSLFMDVFTNPYKRKCDHCGRLLRFRDNIGHQICSDCEDNLPNETGYCSLSCRLGNGCDDSC